MFELRGHYPIIHTKKRPTHEHGKLYFVKLIFCLCSSLSEEEQVCCEEKVFYFFYLYAVQTHMQQQDIFPISIVLLRQYCLSQTLRCRMYGIIKAVRYYLSSTVLSRQYSFIQAVWYYLGGTVLSRQYGIIQVVRYYLGGTLSSKHYGIVWAVQYCIDSTVLSGQCSIFQVVLYYISRGYGFIWAVWYIPGSTVFSRGYGIIQEVRLYLGVRSYLGGTVLSRWYGIFQGVWYYIGAAIGIFHYFVSIPLHIIIFQIIYQNGSVGTGLTKYTAQMTQRISRAWTLIGLGNIVLLCDWIDCSGMIVKFPVRPISVYFFFTNNGCRGKCMNERTKNQQKAGRDKGICLNCNVMLMLE